MAYGIIYTLVEKYLNSEYPIQIIHEAGFVFLSYLHDFFSYYSLRSKFWANNTFSSKVTPSLVCPYSALFCSECGKMRTRITLIQSRIPEMVETCSWVLSNIYQIQQCWMFTLTFKITIAFIFNWINFSKPFHWEVLSWKFIKN